MPNGRHAFADKAAQKGVERVYREGFRYSKAEVLLLDLSQPNEIPVTCAQLLSRLRVTS